MNQQTIDVLGFQTILEHIAEYAKTTKGKSTIRELRPIQEKKKIETLLREVEEAIEIHKISSSVPIHTLDDMDFLIKQAKKGMYIRADQFMYVMSFLQHCLKLKQYMRDKRYAAPNVSLYAESIGDMSVIETNISAAIRNGRVDDHASSNLAYMRRQLSLLLDKLKDKAQHLVKSKRYSNMLQETVVSERGGRFVLAVKREYRSKVQGSVLDTSASGATLFVEPAELQAIQSEIELLKISEEQEVERILYGLTEELLAAEQTIAIAMETFHHYDVLFAKAAYSRATNASIPVLNEDYYIDLREARHPMLGEKAVPLSITFGDEQRALVITGPNTGGKTVTLKTVGLLTVMAQSGLPIPAAEGSNLAIFQHIFLDIGDGQSIEENLSTFSSRLVNIIEILRVTNDRSLVLIDELGSGTDPGEGMALAIVILEQLFLKGATIFATTHYSEMKEFADQTEGFLNATMEFDIDSLQPTYKLVFGQSGSSQAFAIAIKLGMHPKLIEKAHEITYKEEIPYSESIESSQLMAPKYEKQVTVNKYARKRKTVIPAQSGVLQYEQGDHVIVTESNESGIVYKGPDTSGNYIVQVKSEKKSINHKRLKLYIKKEELYPEDYDFDIVFKSKEYRKLNNQQQRKHVDNTWLSSED
ncbi:endonuclease MutS2 [Cytobacillus purgationiresistens]|uniref:MutS2 family protein n=1 Tax=Cytobacillus purgationiresistens TaxID=863449 RepID=A0ABU0AH96_9BACI|nr:endonuclease MutS2 [Cytobacillus purgationiresistens]MDQ0269793.1 MutS2 family protein [Cytobacillus purgationiresistens]